MISALSYLLARMKRWYSCGSGRHCQIAQADIHPDSLVKLRTGWFRDINFKSNEQIALFLGFIIPQFRITDAGTMLDKRGMVIVALIGEGDASVERPDTDLLVTPKRVIPLVGIL
jgi:hypothetical protein